MEFTIDLYKVGYLVGRFGTRAAKISTGYVVGRSAFFKVRKIAKTHKIDSSSAKIVSDNLFECLQYID